MPHRKARSNFRRRTHHQPNMDNWIEPGPQSSVISRIELQARRHARRSFGLHGEPVPHANVGRAHPDYGLKPHEHEMAKRARAELDAKSASRNSIRGGR